MQTRRRATCRRDMQSAVYSPRDFGFGIGLNLDHPLDLVDLLARPDLALDRGEALQIDPEKVENLLILQKTGYIRMYPDNSLPEIGLLFLENPDEIGRFFQIPRVVNYDAFVAPLVLLVGPSDT